MFERNDNQPPDSHDVEYTECERCDGDGWLYLTPHLKQGACTCPDCKGEGQIEIED